MEQIKKSNEVKQARHLLGAETVGGASAATFPLLADRSG
jgi:hypothetical protein